jgi:hypothetical protein
MGNSLDRNGPFFDPVAFVMSNNDWHRHSTRDQYGSYVLRCRSTKYLPPGSQENEETQKTMQDLLVGQRKNDYFANWESLVKSGQIEEGGLIKYKGRTGQLVFMGQKLCITEINASGGRGCTASEARERDDIALGSHHGGNSGTKRAAERGDEGPAEESEVARMRCRTRCGARATQLFGDTGELDSRSPEPEPPPPRKISRLIALLPEDGGDENPKKQKCTSGQIESHRDPSCAGGGSHKRQSPKSDSQPAASHMLEVKRAAEIGTCGEDEATKQQKLTGEGELSVGTTVAIHSLLRANELNGVRGEIVGQHPETGRWRVKIEKEGRLVNLKSSNLRLVSPPSLRDAAKKIESHQDQCDEGPGDGSRDIQPGP